MGLPLPVPDDSPDYFPVLGAGFFSSGQPTVEGAFIYTCSFTDFLPKLTGIGVRLVTELRSKHIIEEAASVVGVHRCTVCLGVVHVLGIPEDLSCERQLDHILRHISPCPCIGVENLTSEVGVLDTPHILGGGGIKVCDAE